MKQRQLDDLAFAFDKEVEFYSKKITFNLDVADYLDKGLNKIGRIRRSNLDKNTKYSKIDNQLSMNQLFINLTENLN